MESCIFCKIIRGEIPCTKVYEDDKVLAFLDISPLTLGHILVVPKKHVETIMDADEQTLHEVMKAVKKLSKSVMKAVKADGINISINNYKAAGQLVPHLHVHIMSRHSKDNLVLYKSTDRPKQNHNELEKVAEQIKKNI
jgi:histidine triad (HIT) family protein